jgi:hypothetical protein
MRAIVPTTLVLAALVLAALGLLLGPTSGRAEGTLAPISPATYRALTCDQIVQEARSVSRAGFTLSGLRPGTGGTDGTDTKAAIILVWPASPHPPSNLRYADSQMDALEQASITSQCSIDFQRPAKG